MPGHGTQCPDLAATVVIGHRWDSKGFSPLIPEKLLEKLQPHFFQLMDLIHSWHMQTEASFAFPALFFPCTAQAPVASSCEQ